MTVLDWPTIQTHVDALAQRLTADGVSTVYGIPRGGAVVAGLLYRREIHTAASPESADALVDDLVDSGRTAQRWTELTGKRLYPLVTKQTGDWIVFPWEERDETSDIEDTVVRQLEFVGEDPKREGLLDTPKRVVKALREMTSGYREDPSEILSTVFQGDNDEMVVVRNIDFASTCEHHMMPFTGTVTIGYLPGDGKVVGLSKLPRLVWCYAKRLQIQEQFTRQIAMALQDHLAPRGVGVIARAFHTCCALRGIRSRNEMVTSSMLGAFRNDPIVRTEFLSFSR